MVDQASTLEVYCGTFEEIMPRIPTESIDLVFTSPPYGVGKDYEPDIRLGVLFGLINQCMEETSRVLVRGGYAAFNFGDIIPARDILGTKEPCEMPMGWIYWSFALAHGLVLQAQRVWQKSFAKITGGKHSISAPRPVPEFEHIYTFRKIGGAARQVMRNRKVSQRAVWSTSGEEGSDAKGHPAAFPRTLARRVIEVYTDPGDTVLDPFAGSGSTGVEALASGRSVVLIEKEPGYCDMIKTRMAPVISSFDE